MENVMALIYVLIIAVVLGVLILVTWGLCELVYHIKDKRHKKWCAWVFKNYPELKVLLNEYYRLRTEYANTVQEAARLQKIIDACVERNKYLPEGRRMDKHIEELKEQYQELLDIREKQRELSSKARAELESFWKTNFPNLREDKWLMWWSE
jgi:5'-deoxynucleotidase YfbR-like HD superfamily hydrolase